MTITFNNDPVATVNSGASGNFTTSFDIPSLAAGAYKVVARDGTNVAEVDFSITTSVTIAPVTIPPAVNPMPFMVSSIPT